MKMLESLLLFFSVAFFFLWLPVSPLRILAIHGNPTGRLEASTEQRIPRRVPIDHNCEAILKGKALSKNAAGIQDIVRALGKSHKKELCLYMILDSSRTFLSSTPTERELLLKLCEGETTGERNWVRLTEQSFVETCYLFPQGFKQFPETAKHKDEMSAYGSKLNQLFQMTTKTILSRDCFNFIQPETVSLPKSLPSLIQKAVADQKSVEDEVFKPRLPTAFPVMIRIQRRAGSPSNPTANVNFKGEAVFFSPNDGLSPIHSQPIVGLLSQEALSDLVATQSISLDSLLQDFAYKAIIINDKRVDPNVIAAITKATDISGAARLARDVELLGFDQYPDDIIEYMNTRPESLEKRHPFVVESQILIIGPAIDKLKTARDQPHVISSDEARKLLEGPAGGGTFAGTRLRASGRVRKPSIGSKPASKSTVTKPAVESKRRWAPAAH